MGEQQVRHICGCQAGDRGLGRFLKRHVGEGDIGRDASGFGVQGTTQG